MSKGKLEAGVEEIVKGIMRSMNRIINTRFMRVFWDSIRDSINREANAVIKCLHLTN